MRQIFKSYQDSKSLKLYLLQKMSSKDAENTLKKAQKCDVRKRCGAGPICRIVLQIFWIIYSFIWSQQKSDKYSKHQTWLGHVFSVDIAHLKTLAQTLHLIKSLSTKLLEKFQMLSIWIQGNSYHLKLILKRLPWNSAQWKKSCVMSIMTLTCAVRWNLI